MTIRPRRNPSGKLVYQLCLGEGKGERRTFKTRQAAKDALADEVDRRARHGWSADCSPRPTWSSIATRLRSQIRDAHRLAPLGGALV
jgi:hypothetical protein